MPASPEGTVRAIFYTHKGKVLLLRRSMNDDHAGCCDIPGGKIEIRRDLAESHFTAMQRELREETGLAFSQKVLSDPIGLNYWECFPTQGPFSMWVFYGHYPGIDPQLNPDEHSEAVLVPMENVCAHPLIYNLSSIILKFYAEVFPQLVPRTQGHRLRV